MDRILDRVYERVRTDPFFLAEFESEQLRLGYVKEGTKKAFVVAPYSAGDFLDVQYNVQELGTVSLEREDITMVFHAFWRTLQDADTQGVVKALLNSLKKLNFTITNITYTLSGAENSTPSVVVRQEITITFNT